MPRHLTSSHARLVGLVLIVASCVVAPRLSAGSKTSAAANEWVTQDLPQVVELREGVKLTLGPATRVVRQPSIPVPNHLKDLAPRAYAVELMSGRLDLDIDTRHPPIYGVMVRAPRRVAAFSKGGRSTILASAQGVVVAATSANEMSGASADKWHSLRNGTALVVSRELPNGTVRDLLKSPTLQVSSPLKLSLGSSEPTRLNWSAIPETKCYKVTLWRETSEGSTPVHDYEVEQTVFELPQLEPGKYGATVAAVNRWQIESPGSNKVPIRVIGVELPKGAYVYHGIPQLGRLQKLHLSEVDELEMAYGSATLFSSVPESLGLATGHPLSVRFREPSGGEEVTLMLEPRSIQGSIEFEPKGARWPGQTVKVTVRLFGPEGSDLPEAVNVALSASVNSKPLDVTWAHEGHTWITRIEQPPLSGPWILRVKATDQLGQILAHDFIEIALPSSPEMLGSTPKYSSRD